MHRIQITPASILFIPLAMLVSIVVLNMEIGSETVIQTYYTQEPLKYEETFVRQGTKQKWQWGWPLRVTVPQVQYGIRNLDSLAGEFLVSVAFDDGNERRNEQRRLTLEPGVEETVAIDSPFQGPQSFDVTITPPSKQVQQQKPVEVSYRAYEKLWQLRELVSLRRR